MESRKELEKDYVTVCCKSSFNILFGELDGEYYSCHKCGNESKELIKKVRIK